MSSLPRDEKFKVEKHISSLLLRGQTIIINDKHYVVKGFTLIPGGYDPVLIAAPIPRLKLEKIEDK